MTESREETTIEEVVHRIREGTFYDDYDWASGPALRALDQAVAGSPTHILPEYDSDIADAFDAYSREKSDMVGRFGITERMAATFRWHVAWDRVRAAIAARDPAATKPRRFQHIKRGSTYREAGRGELQTSRPLYEGETLVSYVNEETGEQWFRPSFEFDDTRRFRPLGDSE